MVSCPWVSFFPWLGYVTWWSHLISAFSAMIPLCVAVDLNWPALLTSYSTLGAVTLIVLWTWYVRHLSAVVGEMLPLPWHLASFVTSMLALAGIKNLISPLLVSPPLTPFGLRPKISSLAPVTTITLMFRCLCGRLIPWSFVGSPLRLWGVWLSSWWTTVVGL